MVTVGLGTKLLGLAGVLALGACSGDFADSAADADTDEGGAFNDEDGAAEETGADGQDDALDGDSEDGGGTDGAPSSDGTGAGDDGGGADEGEDATCNADCGSGQCIRDEAGVPACECNPGSAAFGMRCLQCDKVEADAVFELQTATLNATVTVNGEVPPDSQNEQGDLWLRDRASGDQLYLGNTRDGELTATMLPGTYDVMYDRRVGGGIVPRNDSGVVLSQVELSGTTDLQIDIPAISISGNITVGGQTPPDSQNEQGRLVLVNAANGDETTLGNTRDGAYAAVVLPGSYQLHYRMVIGGAVVPRNKDAYFGDLFVSANDEDKTKYDIDVPIADVSGSFLLNGELAPDSQNETGFVLLVDPSTGERITLGETRDGMFDARVIPMQYDVTYDRKIAGNVLPINEDAIVRTVDTSTETSFSVNIETATIAGDFMVDGGDVPDTSEDAIVVLVDTETGDEIPLGHLNNGAFDRRVMAGSYDVVYQQLSAAGTLPANTGARLTTVDLAPGEDRVEMIDIATASVSGTILLDGAEPPTSEFSDARLYLRNADSGDSVLLGSTRVGGYAGTVVPGTYDLVYVVEAAGEDVPVNTESKILEGITIDGDQEFDLNIPVFDLSAGLSIDGQSSMGDANNRALLLLQDIETEDTIHLGGTDSEDFFRKLTAGTYLVIYEGQESDGLVPANEHAGVACITLTSGE